MADIVADQHPLAGNSAFASHATPLDHEPEPEGGRNDARGHSYGPRAGGFYAAGRRRVKYRPAGDPRRMPATAGAYRQNRRTMVYCVRPILWEMIMWGRSNLVPLAAALCLLGGAGLFSATASAQNSQQNRMKTCNTQAADKHLAGDMRKSFMSDCLAGKTAAEPKMTPQQQKMKDCNTAAGTKNLAGDARKTFMASCLKK